MVLTGYCMNGQAVMNNSPSSAKVFDITKPGKSAPNASSRPIIVTNRPVLKDPMVTSTVRSVPIQDTSSSEETPKATKVTISPVSTVAPGTVIEPVTTPELELPATASPDEVEDKPDESVAISNDTELSDESTEAVAPGTFESRDTPEETPRLSESENITVGTALDRHAEQQNLVVSEHLLSAKTSRVGHLKGLALPALLAVFIVVFVAADIVLIGGIAHMHAATTVINFFSK